LKAFWRISRSSRTSRSFSFASIFFRFARTPWSSLRWAISPARVASVIKESYFTSPSCEALSGECFICTLRSIWVYWLLRTTHAGLAAAAGAEDFAAEAEEDVASAGAAGIAAAGVCARVAEFAVMRPAARIINETAVRCIGRSPEMGIQPAYGLSGDLE
jgi:hypothetical protein